MQSGFGLVLIFGLFLAGPGMAQTVVPGVGAVTTGEVDAFVRADSNGDGVLNYPEFRAFVRQMAASGQSTAITIRSFGAYRLAFRRVDADRNGVATPTELRQADNGFRAGD